MSEQFKVGEIATLQNLVDEPWLNGQDVGVVGGLAVRLGHDTNGSFVCALSYEVDIPGEGVYCIEPKNLRKKRPPTTGEESIMRLFNKTPVAQPELEIA